MSRCPTMNFQLSIMTKWRAKHISTKVSFKITIRKRYAYTDIGWTWIRKQCFSLRIGNDDHTEMIVLPLFQLATRLNSQNKNETEFINEIWHFNLYVWILVFPIGIIEIYTSRKRFFNSFQSLTRLLNSKQQKFFSTFLVGRNGTMWKTWFSAHQNAKKQNQLKKNHVRNRLFIDS